MSATDPITRIAEALERIARAQEAQVLIFNDLLPDEQKQPARAPATIMTQFGEVPLG